MSEKRTIVVVEYDPTWPQTFAALSEVILKVLGPLALQIEHVGSTSVPGLAAKPRIDMDTVIPSWDELPQVIEKLATLGYDHRGNLGIPEREAFLRSDSSIPRDGSNREWMAHNLYVCAQDSRELTRHTTLRDYLRQNPDARDAYGQLKRELAQKHPHNIDDYLDGKSAFILDCLHKGGWREKE